MPSTSNIPGPISEWPSHEQASKLQEIMRDRRTAKVERTEYAGSDDAMTVTFDAPGAAEIVVDADGVDVSEYARVPDAARGITVPVDLLRLVLGDERVTDAVAEAVRTSNLTSYRFGALVVDEFVATLRAHYAGSGE